MTYTVGSVPYLNAKPLVRMFEELGDDSPVKVIYDVPSRLPKLLEEGTVQAIMVSSIEALKQQREDIDGAIQNLEEGCIRLERQLTDSRPDLLPRAEAYDSVLRARLDGQTDSPVAAMAK